ncbi:pyridoxamine 5'-phosphate oxidase family protein [Campylobacter sp. 9BO]|uniref:pyridoxamine 5'-phosphate oxidase family protein n=1 Tax=Campylobacter sp. 9BO TaxID=3424759 RepID=UPI003D33E1A4
MRRKDRELSRDEALHIIDSAQYAVVSCIDGGEVFSVPISIVRDKDSIFLHGAKGGSKASLFKDGKDVELVCVIDVKVPKFSKEQINNILEQGKASSIFTTEYKSAIAKTKAYEVGDDERKVYALKILSQKYTPQYMKYFDDAIKESLKITKIYELKIQTLSAKAKII